MTYKLIDLFCGAGGMTLGFIDPRFAGGFECIFALDNDWSATKTHERNFRGRTITGGIEAWLEQSPNIPMADVVIGGPPCQGFSLLNKNRRTDARKGLWEPFLNVVQQSCARVFVMENVIELLTSPEIKDLVEAATQLGFETRQAVLNSADYGTPQQRKRAIIIGWKANSVATPDFPPATTHSNKESCGLLPWVTVRDAISDLPPPVGIEIRHTVPPMNLHFGRTPTAISVRRYRAVPPGGNRFDLQKNALEITPDCWVRKEKGGTDLFGRLWWERPSVTIRTEFFKPEKGRYLHPDQHRPITHREAARLMGFPDDFEFVGTKIEIAKQIGNAVPPHLAAALAKTVHKMLGLEQHSATTDSFVT